MGKRGVKEIKKGIGKGQRREKGKAREGTMDNGQQKRAGEGMEGRKGQKMIK